MAAEILFMKELTATDVEKRLHFPTEFVDLLFRSQLDLNSAPLYTDDENKVDIRVLDQQGREWSFTCRTRRNQRYLKPVFSRGWRRFVKEHNLGAGDGIIFFRNNSATHSSQVPFTIGVNYRAPR